jgi:hypothetical protein
MTDPLKPQLSLLVKLGSVAVHADEMMSSDGHPFDRVALRGLIEDPEVKEWVSKMTTMAMLPVKRNK